MLRIALLGEQSIVDATVRLFEAEAASIALFERDPERLEFRVASGPKGAGAVGMTVAPNQGIAGYVYSTGEALALSDVAADPRWDRAVAERTGYVPRSIAAVPLVNEAETVGVLQVLDKHSAPSFTMRDMELLAVFASQAAAAIAATKVQRDLPSLIASSLRQVESELTQEQVEALVSTVAGELDVDEETPFWALVDEVSRLRDLERARPGGRHPARGRRAPSTPRPRPLPLTDRCRPSRSSPPGPSPSTRRHAEA